MQARTLSVDLDRELQIRRPALHEQLIQDEMHCAIDLIEARQASGASCELSQRNCYRITYLVIGRHGSVGTYIVRPPIRAVGQV